MADMLEFGLHDDGFAAPTADEIRSYLEGKVRDQFGASMPLGDYTWLGHLIAILSEQLRLLWEIGQASFSALDPDQATGAALEALSLLTGTFKVDAAPSTTVLTLCGADGSVVGEGAQASTLSTGKKFQTTDDATITALDAWAASSVYVVGDRVTNSARCYECITAGTSDAAGGPTTTDADITDNTAHWRYIGEGTAAVDVDAESVETGSIVALAGDISVIETPVGGWDSVMNLADAVEGNDEQSDEELRILREAELRQSGKGTADAIRAAILNVSGVSSATVFYNDSDDTDADGMPPHSVEVLVSGGDDADIWEAVWDNVPVGIYTVGTEVGTVQDSEGFDQTVRFSRPEEILVWVIINLVKYAKEYEGDAAVRQAIVDWGNDRTTQGNGRDVVASAISAAAFDVAGVLDVTSVLIGDVNPPVASTTIPVSRRQVALYDTARITVNSTNGTP